MGSEYSAFGIGSNVGIVLHFLLMGSARLVAAHAEFLGSCTVLQSFSATAPAVHCVGCAAFSMLHAC